MLLPLVRICSKALLGLLNQVGKFFQNLSCFLRMTRRLGAAVLSTVYGEFYAIKLLCTVRRYKKDYYRCVNSL